MLANALGLPPKATAQKEAVTGMFQIVHNATTLGKPYIRGIIEKTLMSEQ
jgi:hypothetical protein